MTREPITTEGKNCLRRVEASRVKFLVDGESYFEAFAAAAEKAAKQIIIVGWDLHSKTRLRVNKKTGELTDQLEDFLDRLTHRNKELRIYLLQWDFAMIYLLEREILPLFQLGWQKNPHIRYKLDDNHPVGGSHHQKIVVIDDRLAFVGGIDITAGRWDTRKHLFHDSRRTKSDGEPYTPFHDVQVALEGEAAGVLGDLVRDRWHRATGQVLAPPAVDNNPWPGEWRPDLQNLPVAIARTDPKWENRPEIREIEQLFLDAIAAAKNCIYLENQFITSYKVTDALAEKLKSNNSPEVVLITRFTGGNWMEEATLDVLRARVIKKLRQADHAGRLRVLYPVSIDADGREVETIIHSKVSIFDDILLRIGSANLSNRSMGLDTECDVAFEAGDDPRISETITAFRNDLLAEHLNVEKEKLDRAVAKEGSLIKALDGFGHQYLRPLDESVDDWLDEVIPEHELVDPEKPLEAEEIVKRFTRNEGKTTPRPVLRLLTIGSALLVLAIAWRWTPLNQWLAPEKLAALTAPFNNSILGPIITLAAFVIGGLLMVPVTALILATALIFGAWKGFFLALTGSLISATTTYLVGSLLWRDTVGKIAGSRLAVINSYLNRRGIMVIIILRVVPVAPFTVINLVAGSAKLSFRDYLAGTFLGMAPGTLALNVFADQAREAITHPGVYSILGAIGLIILIIIGVMLVKRHVERY